MDYGINDLYTLLLIINSTIINMGYNKLNFYSHELDYRKKLAKKMLVKKCESKYSCTCIIMYVFKIKLFQQSTISFKYK